MVTNQEDNELDHPMDDGDATSCQPEVSSEMAEEVYETMSDGGPRSSTDQDEPSNLEEMFSITLSQLTDTADKETVINTLTDIAKEDASHAEIVTRVIEETRPDAAHHVPLTPFARTLAPPMWTCSSRTWSQTSAMSFIVSIRIAVAVVTS